MGDLKDANNRDKQKYKPKSKIINKKPKVVTTNGKNIAKKSTTRQTSRRLCSA